MKAKAIQREWAAYMQQLALSGRSAPVTEGEPMAILFGTDEVKVNAAKRTIKLPRMGAISFEGDVGCLHFDWVAVHQTQGEWSVSFGTGSPFSAEAAELLPSKSGVIHAVPGGIA